MSPDRLSILGIHLGMPAVEASHQARKAGARFAGFLGAHVTYSSRMGALYIQLDDLGSVVSVAGPQLEIDGVAVARVGNPRAELRQALGEPERRSLVDFDRLLEELEQHSPELAPGLDSLQEEREFWWFWDDALSILVDGRGVHSFHLQGTHPGP